MTWAPDYTTIADVKTYLRIGDTADDALLAEAITAASRAIDSITNRQFGQTASTEARKYTPSWSDHLNRWTIGIDDLMDATGLTVALTAGAITLYTLTPVNAAARTRPWIRIVIDKASTVKPVFDDTLPSSATVTAKWGWTAVPATVAAATKIQAARFFKRRDAAFGVAGSPELGSELRLLAKADPDVAFMLRPYTRTRLVLG